MVKVSHESYVTLVSNDAYAIGAMVLGHSLKESKTSRMLTCMVTARVSQAVKTKLENVWDLVVEVDELNSRDQTNLELLCRPELGITFTKLFAWKLTQYTKCCFMDADTLCLQNIDDVFERDELSAAPDVGWPDCFNSGVFVFKPSEETFKKLIEFASTDGSFDGGDQGLLNMYFNDWATKDIKRHLPFTYNLNANATYFYAPAYKYYGSNVKVVHFIGPAKPWAWARDASGKQVLPRDSAAHTLEHVQLWWDVYNRSCPREDVAILYHAVPVMPEQDFSVTWRDGEASYSYDVPREQASVQSQPYNNNNGYGVFEPELSGFAVIQRKLDEMMQSPSYNEDDDDDDEDDDDDDTHDEVFRSASTIAGQVSKELGKLDSGLNSKAIAEATTHLKKAEAAISKARKE